MLEFVKNFPNLSDESKQICEGSITHNECLKTLKQVQKNPQNQMDSQKNFMYDLKCKQM